MKHLKIFEEFSPIVDNIFYKFAYPGQLICKKGLIYNPNTDTCISKLDFINDRLNNIYPKTDDIKVTLQNINSKIN